MTEESEAAAALEAVAPGTPGHLPPVDGRSRLARTFRNTRSAVVESLGGPENISAQQALAIRQLAEAEALRSAIFARATRGESYAVADYAALAAIGQRALKLLGMRQIAKDVPSLRGYLDGQSTPDAGGPSSR